MGKKAAIVARKLRCAVMFVDIRDSTTAIAKPGNEDEVVERLTQLTEVFDRFADSGTTPDFLKSTGDGLMCVWHLDGKDPLPFFMETLLDLAIQLHTRLPAELTRWGTPPRVGIGISAGMLQYITRANGSKDYFGYFAHLASKLQDSARPDGIVIAGDYYKQLSREYRRHDTLFCSRDIPSDSPLHRYHIENCYTTASVLLAYNWTCLAWPGFAITENDEDHGDPQHRRPIGLNTKGVTVVSHEGLRGNIGSLKIWRAHAQQDGGDTFEMFIDDYDALQSLCAQQLLELWPRSSHGTGLGRIARAFRQLCSGDNRPFFFLPIRCGVNALASHIDCPVNIERLAEYSEVHTALKNSEICPEEIGLYDNMGATMPILMMMMCGLRHNNVLAATNADLETALTSLRGQASHLERRHRFQRYTSIGAMAQDLQAGKIKLVLGGGAWLANPETIENTELVFSLPRKSGGLLWVEGAALSLHVGEHKAAALISFLNSAVLSDSYQGRLAYVKPYASSPVIHDLAAHSSETGGYSPVNEETKRIYSQNDGSLNDLLTIRTRPANDPAAWMEAFRDIMTECCDDPLG